MPDMSEGAAPDLSRIVNLILENPKLIQEISKLAEKSRDEGASPPPEAEAPSVLSEPTSEPVSLRVAESSSASSSRERRAMLISALKPYISGERAKAIDSMMSVVEVFDMMKSR